MKIKNEFLLNVLLFAAVLLVAIFLFSFGLGVIDGSFHIHRNWIGN